jgi:tetratricopeptide (TPR) repeat protein
VRLNLGVALAGAGRPAEGSEELEAALQLWSAAPDPRRIAVAELALGRIELDRSRPAVALERLQRAHELFVAEHGEDHRRVAEARVALARALAANGQRARARQTIDRALEVLDGIDRADALFVSARLHGRRAEAEEAAALFADAETRGFAPARRAEVEAWLNTRRR